ncbi:PhnD/SsuA/transferrin family substrate-binding protein [Poseidonibacter ostreae]|jgi:ABC-type phosphate/phosphonate transport system substrate-binding protein|uniref:PhnD/SsuA/transferrin family substrate-binding protein n=1 Tax=Poseidonibacter ostreae TaxID=2654171 RepID=A0A6L4WU52_9BACT|nr:PhnD/SsuA/transferrin family substrate-binding protein [Poseidonibacter ostreae]KAB7885044.1 PhnD/SsuA/transferrin family substrate-binding protein [Poseidonibacter ostreae]KAB7887894.1 PhnD/SsuA/transferrin family substrate-binding protein [Poseidonibacter ostreae]KAB7891163.1 PhnD/SsuA/transferrin family substrate-binding protein [Poseidonibacter ostreae]
MKKILLIIFLFIFTINSFSNEKKIKNEINYGFIHSYDILADFKDARESLSKWLGRVGEKKEINLNVTFYDDRKKVFKNYMNHSLNMVSMEYGDYYKHKNQMDPISSRYWSVSFNEKREYKFCLVARNDIKFDSYKDLKNKTIIMKKYQSIGSIWLDYKSLENTKKDFSKLVKSVKYESKESTSLLNVFFKKQDLALVRKTTWTTMLELNPSLKQRVKLFECSNIDFIPFISVFSKSTDNHTVNIFFEALQNLKDDSDINELYSLFKFYDVYEVKKEDLLDMNNFYNEYYKLKKKHN